MTLCKMVENCSLGIEKPINNRECCSELEGTKHLATIVVATKGTIVVRAQIDGVVYAGVLLDTSASSIAPSLLKLPTELESSEQSTTTTVEPADCELDTSPVTEAAPSTCELRRTYLLEPRSSVKPIVIPSRSSSLAASLLRHQDRRQLRERRKTSKGKLYLCSMCKTHCLDTDNSDIENVNTDNIGVGSVASKTTPPIRISFKSPEGPSIMEIEPREYRKRRHSSKHKSKKHSKRSKKDKSNDNNSSPTKDELLAEDNASAKPVVSDNSADQDSADNSLVIDLPSERPGRLKRSSRPTTKPVKRSCSVDSGSAASDTVVDDNPQYQSKTKTKARLRKQKYASKAKPAAAESTDVSVVSEKSTRFVSTYESAGGKRISVGDIIWGKIVGFPWWPGRVCAISVSENKEGIMGHTADIDWYCSPTKSHLPCSDIYQFLEDFSKRLDKKKKTKSYLQAIDEAKRDAVMNEQYLQTLAEEQAPPMNSNNTVPCQTEQPAQAPSLPTNADSVTESRVAENPQDADEKGNDSPSLLVDAFLRTNEQSNDFSTQLKEFDNSATQADSAANTATNDDTELEGCLTISLPSPQSLLDSH